MILERQPAAYFEYFGWQQSGNILEFLSRIAVHHAKNSKRSKMLMGKVCRISSVYTPYNKPEKKIHSGFLAFFSNSGTPKKILETRPSTVLKVSV